MFSCARMPCVAYGIDVQFRPEVSRLAFNNLFPPKSDRPDLVFENHSGIDIWVFDLPSTDSKRPPPPTSPQGVGLTWCLSSTADPYIRTHSGVRIRRRTLMKMWSAWALCSNRTTSPADAPYSRVPGNEQSPQDCGSRDAWTQRVAPIAPNENAALRLEIATTGPNGNNKLRRSLQTKNFHRERSGCNTSEIRYC